MAEKKARPTLDYVILTLLFTIKENGKHLYGLGSDPQG